MKTKSKLIFASLILSLLVFNNQTSFSQSAWFWQSTVPQGNTLNDVCIINSNKIVAVGGLSTVMRSNNGGANWDIKYRVAGPYKYLSSVFFVNENTGWITGYQGTVLKTTDGGVNWTLQEVLYSFYNSTYFADSNNGWITGYSGEIINTTNGGLNWNRQTSNVADYLYSVEFVNKNTGWAVGGNGDERAHIIKTTNGGVNWLIQKTLYNYEVMRSVSFINESTGWAVGDNKLVLKTTDAGVNWIITRTANIANLYGVDFKDSNTGWAVGYEYYFDSLYLYNTKGAILKTTDGGANWIPQINSSEVTLLSVEYKDNVCMAVGSTGILLKSTGDNDNWISLSKGVQHSLNAASFLNDYTGWSAGREGTIVKTTDSGNNWLRQQSGTYFDLADIQFANKDTGWVVGGYEDIFTGYKFFIKRSVDGGQSWHTQDSGIFPFLSSICFTSNSVGWITGQGGTLLYTSNAGDNWNFRSAGSTDFFKSVFFIDSAAGWILGERGNVLRTTNAGVNWTIRQVTSSANFGSFFFIDHSTGWITAGGNRIYKTTDGINWFLNYAGQNDANGFNSIYFTDANTGWGAGYQYGEPQAIKKTTNGGQNWVDQIVDAGTVFNSIVFTSPNTGWAVGDDGVILKTDNLVGLNEVNNILPDNYYLKQNFPNPFNPVTHLEFGIPLVSRSGEYGFVSLKVFDVLGKEVAVLVNEQLSPGNYVKEFDGSNYPSGVYFYSLLIDGNVKDTKRMVLLK
ncbi:MAG: YCF48-related protein [Ignavibacteria bacterium]